MPPNNTSSPFQLHVVVPATISLYTTVRFNLYLHLFCWKFMFYLCYLCLSTYTGVQYDFHIRWCSCNRKVTQSMPIVKQDLPTLPKNLNSPPAFCEVCVVQSSVFCVVFCRSLFFFLSLFDHCTKGEIKCIIWRKNV